MIDSITIPFKTKMIKLTFAEFSEEIDMDQITKIDYSNLHAELLTVPTLMNRIGLWKADADNVYASKKLDLSVAKAQAYNRIGKTYKSVKNSKGDPVDKPKTREDIDAEITMDQGIQVLQRNLINRQRDCDYLDSLYWAIKSKEQKLNKIGEKMNLTPEDFEREIVEQTWNGILIQAAKKQIRT